MNSVEQKFDDSWTTVAAFRPDCYVTYVSHDSHVTPNLSGDTKIEPPVVYYHRLIFADFNDIYQMFILCSILNSKYIH